MIITRTPYRISLFGGGTDYPKWFTQHGGACISFTIDKYSYITAKELLPFFEHQFRISHSKIEVAKDSTELKHKAFREVIRKYARGGVEIHHHGDLPAMSGMGSSSAFIVGIIHALLKLNEEAVSAHELALRAIDFEQEILEEIVGSQDQIACAYGGFNRIDFHRNGSWSVKALGIPNERVELLEKHLLLVFSRIQRISSDVSIPLFDAFDRHEKVMFRLMEMVEECESLLTSENGTLSELGRLLDESWKIKKIINPLSVNLELQKLYDLGMENGATGGKVLGAGGGGFVLFFCEPSLRDTLLKALDGFIVVPFKIEFHGSTAIGGRSFRD